MKKVFFALMICFSFFAFSACSGKVQTNKIPNDSKYVLPKLTKKEKIEYVQTQELQDFSIFLEKFFGQKRSITENNENANEDFFQIGIDRKYFYINNATKNIKTYDGESSRWKKVFFY